MNLKALSQGHRWMQRAGLPLLLLLAGGCSPEEIRVYQVPKEAAPADPRTASAAPAAPPELKWTLPEGWQAQPRSGIRAANFLIPGPAGQSAEVSVVALPGVNAAMTDIVNMWRQQIGLSEVKESEVAGLVEKVRIGPGQGELFDMAGTADGGGDAETRLLVAMAQDNGVSWFFKMTGATALVGEKRASFLAFLESVEYEYPKGTMTAAAAPGGGHGDGHGTGTPGPGAKPHWTVPAGWTESPPLSMGLARFEMGGGGSGGAEMTVSVFPGAAGGAFANVNRWRGQLGLAPVDEAGLGEVAKPFEEAGSGSLLVDMTGDKRLLGAIVVRDGQSWFYKLTGDAAVVEREKGAFVEFVKTVDYSHAH